MHFFTSIGFNQINNTRANKSHSPKLSKLALAFKYEQKDDIRQELLACKTIDELMLVDMKGLKAWQFKHVSQKSIKLVIERYLELSDLTHEQSEYYKSNLNDLAPQTIMRLIGFINQSKNRAIVNYDLFIKQDNYYQLQNAIKDMSDLISFVLDNSALFLLSMHQQFGSDFMTLNTGLSSISSALLFISSGLRLNQLCQQKKKFSDSQKSEISFILTSLILAVIGIISSSSAVVFIGIAISIMTSVFDIYNQWQNYKKSPLGTDRRVAYLQQCIKQSISFIHSAIASALTISIMAGAICLVPAMVGLLSLTVSLLIWQLSSRESKLNFKIQLGFEKKSYKDELEQMSIFKMSDSDSDSDSDSAGKNHTNTNNYHDTDLSMMAVI